MTICNLCGKQCLADDAVELSMGPMVFLHITADPVHACGACRDRLIYPVLRNLVERICEHRPGEIEKFDLMMTLAAPVRTEPA